MSETDISPVAQGGLANFNIENLTLLSLETEKAVAHKFSEIFGIPAIAFKVQAMSDRMFIEFVKELIRSNKGKKITTTRFLKLFERKVLIDNTLDP